MKRLFLAIDLSVQVVERLVRLQEELEAQVPEGVSVRWTDPRNIHATLKYFGEVEDDLVPFIEASIVNLAKPLFAFEVKAKGIGAFPDASEPRIVWTGFDASGGEVFGLLQQNIEKEMAELGFAPDERAFHPHITIGRLKSPETVSFEAVVEAFSEFEFGSCLVRDIALFESQLTPSGPVYTVVRRFALGT